MSTISKFSQLSSKTLLAFCQVTSRIFECKKFHTNSEELILPATVNPATTMIGEEAAKKLNVVTLFDNNMCHRIGDMAEDVHDQLSDQLKQQEFNLQLNEATDDVEIHT